MRRLLRALLVLMLFTGFAYAEISAVDAAAALQQSISQMSDVRNAPLNELNNRAVWNDNRVNARCALAVFEDEAAATEVELAESTRDVSVRAVGRAVLYLDTDLGIETICVYEQCLAEVLGIELNQEEPDYILNVNTGKFHCPQCNSVLEIKETNKLEYEGDREGAIEHAYVPCKRCNP